MPFPSLRQAQGRLFDKLRTSGFFIAPLIPSLCSGQALSLSKDGHARSEPVEAGDDAKGPNRYDCSTMALGFEDEELWERSLRMTLDLSVSYHAPVAAGRMAEAAKQFLAT